MSLRYTVVYNYNAASTTNNIQFVPAVGRAGALSTFPFGSSLVLQSDMSVVVQSHGNIIVGGNEDYAFIENGDAVITSGTGHVVQDQYVLGGTVEMGVAGVFFVAGLLTVVVIKELLDVWRR